MRRLTRVIAKDGPAKPRLDIVWALGSLMGHFNKRSIDVSQKKLLERIRGTTGHGMSRRTLNRHLATLERSGFINRIQRHRRARSGSLELRATNYTLGQRGILLIKNVRDSVLIPFGRLAVPLLAQSQKTDLYRKARAVDKAFTARTDRAPRKRGAETAPESPSRTHPAVLSPQRRSSGRGVKNRATNHRS